MKRTAYESVKLALANHRIYDLFAEKIGTPEEVEDDNNNAYALIYSKGQLFFLDYATRENGNAKTYEQQNDGICIGYVSATDILMGDPAGQIEEELLWKVEQAEQMEKEYSNR